MLDDWAPCASCSAVLPALCCRLHTIEGSGDDPGYTAKCSQIRNHWNKWNGISSIFLFCSTWENNHRPLATRQSRFMSSQYFQDMCLDTVTRSEEHNKSLQSPNGSQNLLVFTRDSPVRHVGFFIKDHLSHTHWWKETQPCCFTSLWGLWLNSFGYGITAIFCYASYIENN